MAYYEPLPPYDLFSINSYSGFQEHQDIEFERGELYVIRYKYGFPYFIGEFYAYNSVNNKDIPSFKIVYKSKYDILRVGKFDRIWVHKPGYIYKKAVDFPRLDYLSLISISGSHGRENREDERKIYEQRSQRFRNELYMNGGKRYYKSKKNKRAKRKTKKRQRKRRK